MVVPVSFRCRKACLTPADLRAFSTLLVEYFPTARYFADPDLQGLDGPWPPEVVIAFRLHDLRDYEVYMTFDEDWLPQWGRAGYYGEWSLAYPRLPYVRFLVGRMRSADQRFPERIDSLEIQCSCRPHRKEDFAIARRLFHLLGKVATNRNQVYVGYPRLRGDHRVREGRRPVDGPRRHPLGARGSQAVADHACLWTGRDATDG